MSIVLDSLNRALHEAMASDESVYVIGEDLLDPYGGAFKVTRGLSTKFPNRVLSSPVSEAGIVGVAGGMALGGLRPVVEIMFGDFTTLIADQLINGIAKFRWIYNEQIDVPLVIRTPMGGRRGYGPTHSQTLEKLYLGAPGLRILAPCALGNPGELLKQAILEDDQPVLFIENKLLYTEKIADPETLADFDLGKQTGTYAPTYSLSLREAPPARITLAAYGYMAGLAREAALKLAYQHEIFTELVVPTQLAPFEGTRDLPEAILASVKRTGRLLTIEEGTLTLGWGAELLARTATALGADLKASQRIAAADTPIPAARSLEDAMLPQVEDIVRAAREML